MRDYYDILGVSKDASDEDIKKAYRKLAHKYHPDKGTGDEAKFKEINEAYQTLSNKQKRAQYDNFGQSFGGGSPFGGAGGWDINFNGFEDLGDLEDIFSTFFDGLGVRQRRRTYKKGGDIQLNMEVTLEEAQKGKVANMKYETYAQCEKCAGVGHDKDTEFKKCDYCGGQGRIKETRNTFFGGFAHVVNCPECRGSGEIPKKVCVDCKGSGRVQKQRDVRIEVRPGVEDGQIIKAKGMGEAGENNASSGDLYVKVIVKEHPDFKRKGNDLYKTVEASLTDVMLDREIEVESLSGEKLKVKVPSGFSLNDELRVKGEGMTSMSDLVVNLDIKTPKKLSKKAKKLLEDLGKELE